MHALLMLIQSAILLIFDFQPSIKSQRNYNSILNLSIGFQDRHQSFFSKGRKYRVPGYLATAFDKMVTTVAPHPSPLHIGCQQFSRLTSRRWPTIFSNAWTRTNQSYYGKSSSTHVGRWIQRFDVAMLGPFGWVTERRQYITWCAYTSGVAWCRYNIVTSVAASLPTHTRAARANTCSGVAWRKARGVGFPPL